MDKMKIYIAAHKNGNMPEDSIYQPIQVGTSLSEGRFTGNYVYDNEGDHISDRNKSFCELTAIYWIWKNDSSDIVGLTHYRRFFVHRMRGSLSDIMLKSETIYDILKKHDMILPSRELLDASVEYDYCQFHFRKDYDILRDVVREIYPDYLSAFDKFSKQNYMSKYNMMICKKELWDTYCDWLFTILFEVEKRTDISGYSLRQKRLYGYLSERLLNVWAEHNNLSVAYVKVKNIDETLLYRAKGAIYKFARYVFHIDVYEYQRTRKIRLFKESGDG